jgi:gliding motility-associated-like protein
VKPFKPFYLFLLLFVIHAYQASGTHQRAAEITFRHISGYTYEFKLISYTFTNSPADRPSLDLNWGDGTSSTLPRILKQIVPGSPEITRNEYIGNHTFQTPGTFQVTMEDPNRNAGVLNIPYSVNVPMFISTTIVVNPFLGPNNSPVLTFPPIDKGCLNVPFYHNPGAYDPDGDSLAYELIPCRGENGQNIIGYTNPSTSNIFSIDSETGTLTWDSPIIQGEYNVAILIKEYRNGFLMSAITRDMQIYILPCNNQPPQITVIDNICVDAGDLVVFNVFATDPENHNLTLSASGGPFNTSTSPAVFPTITGFPPLSGTFTWQTSCSHVRKNPWPVYFRAQENNNTVNLIDIKTTFITVVAPAPENLTATASGNSIQLQWNISPCSGASGYKIYRRTGSYGFNPAQCETGVPAYTGYSFIAQTYNINDTLYTDNNNGNGLSHGPEYCYMVIAVFPDGAESYASNEACTSLIKDIPVITNVSIRETHQTNGSVFIAWSKPDSLDVITYPGPYEYRIFRGEGFSPTAFSLVGTLNNLTDTVFIDSLINTLQHPWSYFIELWDFSETSPRMVGETVKATSVFLTIQPFDQALILNWEFYVPWFNTSYTIYRYNDLTMSFDSVGISGTTEFFDPGLENGKEYCYKIKSSGSYFTLGFIDPILNFSQVACQVPVDLISPCTPELSVVPECEIPSNFLTWTNPITECEYSGDVGSYIIYFLTTLNGSFNIIHTETDPYTLSFRHFIGQTVAGCYTIVAVDTTGNVSAFSDTICIDIDVCDLYRLPNIFTPNDDGYNDFWIPFPYDFVEKIDLQVFNRWGKVVFQTQDPEIRWDGRHYQNGQEVAEGVYFYVCDVYEARLSGLTKRTLSGSVTLLRNPKNKIY